MIDMADEEPARIDRTKVTFAQAEGVEPLPTPLALKTVSPALVAAVWNVIDLYMNDTKVQRSYSNDGLGEDWRAILRNWHVTVEHKFGDEFKDDIIYQRAEIKQRLSNKEYISFFEFLQFILRSPTCPRNFSKVLNHVFESCHAAYFVDDKTIYPKSSPEEGEALQRALSDSGKFEFKGARAHLRASAEALQSGDYAGSVRESVTAVESIAMCVEPDANDLGKALAKLKAGSHIETGMQRAFNQLFGYGSNEKGIRHALLFEDKANVDEEDAIFMLGACAGFVSYVIRKAHLQT